MRSVKELLEVLLKNQQHFTFGLCSWFRKLYFCDIISSEESILLDNYIKEHRPSKYSSIGAWKTRNSNWYWPTRKIAPRLKWINQHIKKLSNE
jgi:hypothetical protein